MGQEAVLGISVTASFLQRVPGAEPHPKAQGPRPYQCPLVTLDRHTLPAPQGLGGLLPTPRPGRSALSLAPHKHAGVSAGRSPGQCCLSSQQAASSAVWGGGGRARRFALPPSQPKDPPMPVTLPFSQLKDPPVPVTAGSEPRLSQEQGRSAHLAWPLCALCPSPVPPPWEELSHNSNNKLG